jgi:S1-C subfamily serine protease
LIPETKHGHNFALIVAIAIIIVASAASGYLYSYSTRGVQTEITTQTLVSTSYTSFPANQTQNLDPISIYSIDTPSVVTVQGAIQGVGQILGSGFVVLYQNSAYVVTNFHVVDGVTNITVTFSDGNSYAATVTGSDPYSDLAIVSVQNAPASEFHPIAIGNSSQLVVGQPVAAIGNPYGFAGSMTVGIVSQLDRTLQESTTGNFSIANVIQFSAQINPGNSGGPLLDAKGEVVGITTAIIGGSQGVGFAIPSDTLLREIGSLVTIHQYNNHPYMGIAGADMNYYLAKTVGTNYTYGVLVESVDPNGPAAKAGIKGGSNQVTVQGVSYIIGGDIIVSINNVKIVGYDALASYNEQYTLPGQTISVGIIRNGNYMTVSLVMGVRPPPP